MYDTFFRTVDKVLIHSFLSRLSSRPLQDRLSASPISGSHFGVHRLGGHGEMDFAVKVWLGDERSWKRLYEPLKRLSVHRIDLIPPYIILPERRTVVMPWGQLIDSKHGDTLEVEKDVLKKTLLRKGLILEDGLQIAIWGQQFFVVDLSDLKFAYQLDTMWP